MEKEIFDITIIGAGPVGLFTGFYAGLRQAKFKIIDSLEKVGGQPKYLYPEKNIYDIPAFTEINGEHLTENLLKQLSRFDYSLELGQEVIDIHKEESNDYFCLVTSQQIHYSKTVIIAAGNGAFNPKKLNLPNANQFEGHNLSYYVQAKESYTDKVVVICGGGDSAVDWALELEPFAKKVYLVHRRDKFRALESSVKSLKESSVEILTPYVPAELIGNNHHLQQLIVKEARGDNTLQIDLDDLIINYGFSSSIGTIRHWGLSLERNALLVDHSLESSIPGIFAVGDIAHYPNKVKLIATGFGEAPLAVNQALLTIDPNNTQPPIHSSDLF